MDKVYLTTARENCPKEQNELASKQPTRSTQAGGVTELAFKQPWVQPSPLEKGGMVTETCHPSIGIRSSRSVWVPKKYKLGSASQSSKPGSHVPAKQLETAAQIHSTPATARLANDGGQGAGVLLLSFGGTK